MYVVTFYSFKGGVGRTLALVNVGVELARRGRRVLLVDFDLEAPGIETFNLPTVKEPPRGIVDYVTHYIETGEAPDVREHIYESAGIGQHGGRLWIMPAGKRDEKYAHRLSSIDWQLLYSELNGYLLMEDLKAQWKEVLDPDYVLVDSRTGYTDIAGVCTRQLPDSVVVMFFPNEQNLRGLAKILADIRLEGEAPSKKTIQLHFVTSNVPDLDDEEQIFETRMRRFQETLDYKGDVNVIHHYSSLALLNQVVFTLDRPRSRLAQEYRDLVKTIIGQNLEDREGALAFLRRVTRHGYLEAGEIEIPPQALDERLNLIRKRHADDGEILDRLALIRERQGRVEEALGLLDEAVNRGNREPTVLLRRAEIRIQIDEKSGALADIREVLDSTKASYFAVSRAIRWLRDLDPDSLKAVPATRAVQSLNLEARLQVVHELEWSYDSIPLAEGILRDLLHHPEADEKNDDRIRNELSLCLIALGRFREAMEVLSVTRPAVSATDAPTAFNYGIAEWALTKNIPQDLFHRVIQLDGQNGAKAKGVNYTQCLAICHWLTRDVEEARRRIAEARREMVTQPQPAFSAWRYLIVSPEDFLQDLELMEAALTDMTVLPAFIGRVEAK